MTALINELFKEAIERSHEFVRNAQEAEEGAGDVAERARALTSAVEEESSEAHGLFQEATSQLREAEAELESAVQKAGSEMEGLRTQVAQVEAKVAALVAAVKSGADELEALKGQLTTDLDQRHETANGLFQDAAQRAEDLQGHLGERLQATSQAVTELNEAVSQAQSGLEESRARFLEGLEELGERAQTQVEAYADSVASALQEATQTLVDCGNQMVAAHNQAMEDLRVKFTEEAVARAETSFEPVRAAVEALGDLCRTQETELGQRADAILQKVEEALRLSEGLSPILQQAALLG
jgi:chromosome segregation ATPase